MSLVLRLFGPFSCMIDDAPLPPLRSRRGYLLLASLILRGGRAVSRETLMASLWPEGDTKSGQENLRRTLTDLRKALGTEAHRIVSDGHQSVRFVLDDAVFVDVLRFDALAARWEKIGDWDAAAEAIALYRGPLLENFDAEWIPGERAAREEQCREMLESLARRALQTGDAARAVLLARRAERIDPLNAATQRLLYEALAATGDSPAAQRAYREFRDRLYRETNQEPDEETRALVKGLQALGAMRAGASPALTDESGVGAGLAPALPAPSATPMRIPFPVSELVGREAEIEQVASLLAKRRLVTLTGSGGIGKTRLSLAVAACVASDFREGVWFIDLSAVTDPAQVALTIAHALETPEQKGHHSLIDALRERLAGKRSLLVLDNCEHLRESCAAIVAALLESLPELHTLATSRMPLGVAGERVWRVPPLSFPPPSRTESASLADSLMEYAGPRLFVARAMSASSAFALTESNVPAIVQICARLDGIPLALELAAARVASLSAEQISVRLEDAFRLLTTGARTVLPRQQTLQALVDWSYALLEEPEKALLGRLSTFAGGWTLEAAEAVGGLSAKLSFADNLTFSVLDALAGLVDKSLVLAEEADGAKRYRMLETVRQYAQKRLRESGEGQAIQARHWDYFLTLAEEAYPKLRGPEQTHWLSVLEAEHDNLRQALTFSLEKESGNEAALRLGVALQPFWGTRGHVSEGRERLAALLSLSGSSAPTRRRADALNGAGALAWMQGDYSAARSLHEESLAIQRKLGNPRGIASSLSHLGNMARDEGEYSVARSFYEESLTLYRKSGDKNGVASALNNLGNISYDQGNHSAARSFYEESLTLYRELQDKSGVASALNNQGKAASHQGDYSAARSLYQESLTLRRELGDKNGIASALNNLGKVTYNQGDYSSASSLWAESLTLYQELGDKSGIAYHINGQGIVAYDRGDYAAARSLHEQSLTIQQELRDKNAIAYCLNDLGNVTRAQGDYAAARSLCGESLTLQRELGNRHGVAYSLEAFASLAVKEGQGERATRLWAAADGLHDAIGSGLAPLDKASLEAEWAAVRMSMGEAAFAAAWEAGRAMNWEQAATYALEEKLG